MTGAAEPVIISALNHFVFCPRRAALVHTEGVEGENAYLVEGLLLHRRADEPSEETRDGVRIVRALPLRSLRYGLVGKADVVEFRPGPDGREVPYPVETKRGPRRPWENDDVQVCAQGLCLEEMFGVDVPAGAIFHAGSKRRREVPFDERLREETIAAIKGLRALLASGRTPPAVLHNRCDGCSVRAVCLPEVTETARRVASAAARLYRIEEAR